MILIQKKRIIFVLSMVFISVFVYFFSVNTEQTIETVSLPVTNKVVVIDAGHGSPDEGGSLLHQVKNRSNYFFIKNNCRCKSLQFF